MTKVRTVIVDDEPLARRRIRRLLHAEPDIEVIGECGDGAAAATAIEEQAPDLVFLDIQMPEMDGFDVLEALSPERRPVVVFVTAHDEHALRAFEVHALDYLLKPIDPHRFAASVTRAVAEVQLRGQSNTDWKQRLAALLDEVRAGPKRLKHLLIRDRGRFIPVDIVSIDWIEAAGKHVKLHVGADICLLRERLHRLEAKLDPEQFLRIHRSVIVNVKAIRELEPAFHGDCAVLLKDGTHLTLSRSYRPKLDALFGISR